MRALHDPATGFLERLDAVEERLAGLADAPGSGLTPADPSTGEQWEAGQVWAHLAEFIPYWLAQAERLVHARTPGPQPFGRTKADRDRIAAIERGRGEPVPVHWQQLSEDLNDLRAFLRELPLSGWEVRGRHETLGVMPMERIVEEFLVGHLEEHAAQLESLKQG